MILMVTEGCQALWGVNSLPYIHQGKYIGENPELGMLALTLASAAWKDVCASQVWGWTHGRLHMSWEPEDKYAAYRDLPYLYLPEMYLPTPLNFILTAGQNYHMLQTYGRHTWILNLQCSACFQALCEDYRDIFRKQLCLLECCV